MLTRPINNQEHVELLHALREMRFRQNYFKDHLEELVDVLGLLGSLTEDVWFTRTWIFQERYCSSRLLYLVPIVQKPPASNEGRLPPHMINELLNMGPLDLEENQRELQPSKSDFGRSTARSESSNKAFSNSILDSQHQALLSNT